MFVIIEITGFAEALFVSIPESVGLLAFGLGLIGTAVTGRWLVARAESKKKEQAGPEA